MRPAGISILVEVTSYRFSQFFIGHSKFLIRFTSCPRFLIISLVCMMDVIEGKKQELVFQSRDPKNLVSALSLPMLFPLS